MIHEVTGDILLSNAQTIAHGIAAADHFDVGLALSLRERWPAMAKDFRHWCHTTHPKAGALWLWSGADRKRIACLLTQDAAPNEHARPGAAQLPHVHHALRELARTVIDEHIQSLALPKLATGVGGLAWDKVYPLIQEHLGPLSIPVYVYTTFKANERAVEG